MNWSAAPFLAFIFSVGAAWSQSQPEKPLPVDGRIEVDGSAIHLSLAHAMPPRVGNVAVKRRTLGETGGRTWEAIAPQLGPVLRFTDTNVRPGTAYEYQVLRTARDIVDVGYFTAGVEIPAVESRGTALVVVDDTLADDLSLRLDRFERDLIGDGWDVIRHRTARGSDGNFVESLEQAATLKSWIQEQYFSDPFARHALILVGHVPIALTGKARPDGHDPVPHASDLFYAEMDGTWRLVRNAEGKPLLGENRLPSDTIEMQVGRIDFKPVSTGDRDKELRLLRAYFDKNHHWRHGLLGDLRGGYAKTNHLLVERDGLRNIVGTEFLVEGGHHDAGEERPWLWGVDFGDHKVANYADYAMKATFVINFGSHKQKIQRFGNVLSATLAQPWHTVAAGWGGRPAWRLHAMALGGTIGESHMRTVNNGIASESYRESMDYFPTGHYLWRNPVWVNLLGDPTLRAFMLPPPSVLRADAEGEATRLSWSPSPARAVQSYVIYREDELGSGFEKLAEVSDGESYLDATPPEGARYMVRAYGLQQVHAGSFYTYSQGVFAERDAVPPVAPDIRLNARDGAMMLDFKPRDLEAATTEAFLHGPDQGDLQLVEGAWRYTPSEGATGEVVLPYTRSSRHGTAVGRYVITLGD